MKPRIVILSAFLTPFRSGAEACSEEVPRALCDAYDFVIITARLRKDLPSEETWENGKIRIVRVGTGNFFFDKWLYPFRAAKEAAKELDRAADEPEAPRAADRDATGKPAAAIGRPHRHRVVVRRVEGDRA